MAKEITIGRARIEIGSDANKLKAEDIIKIEHAHPVLYESFKEAILVALGRPIHA